jgi:hypothetical protein
MWVVNTTLQVLFASRYRTGDDNDDSFTVSPARPRYATPLCSDAGSKAVSRLSLVSYPWPRYGSPAPMSPRYALLPLPLTRAGLNPSAGSGTATQSRDRLASELSDVAKHLRLVRRYVGHMQPALRTLEQAAAQITSAVGQWEDLERELRVFLRAGLVSVETATTTEERTSRGTTPVVVVTERRIPSHSGTTGAWQGRAADGRHATIRGPLLQAIQVVSGDAERGAPGGVSQGVCGARLSLAGWS